MSLSRRRAWFSCATSPVSRRKRYYADNNEDALVLWIEDTSRPAFRKLYEQRLAELVSGP